MDDDLRRREPSVPPAPEPDREPAHPWARHGVTFDWDAERERQKREGAPFVESDDDRDEREASIRGPH